MPIPPPDGITGIEWIIGLTIFLAIPALTTLFTQRKTRRDVASIKSQVENTHESNLRDDIDEVKHAAARNETAIGRLTLFISDLDESVKAQAHSIERRYALTHAEIAELNENLRAHIADTAPLFAAHEAATHDSQ